MTRLLALAEMPYYLAMQPLKTFDQFINCPSQEVSGTSTIQCLLLLELELA
jgi:hypothetical protein